ncbi:LRR receptor-like serine/threonine-protein kinase FLS2 [Solanum lycopersicum]|uniref:Leucine-rich repeat-containing N-terminal plant-type domain-containing protein n=1 Tax=Solanum lycopersicum TaxID=4081 RepID=A0A3Q7GLS4_SOLLC|nr:LRR receptor-like serine/threonine-protein kinase FLS2 [Solanum lycopersicum]
MARLVNSIFFTFLYISLIYTLSPFVNATTSQSDIQVLVAIKTLIDPFSITADSFLNSWDFNVDPCETTGASFLGILCTVPDQVDTNATSRIMEIDLEGDGLEGFLTSSIGNLTELVTLNLGRNKFRGPVPESITNLRKLTSLQLYENFFSGSLVDDIGVLSKLENLDVSNNRLSGSIPSSIMSLRSLTRLDLSNNEFTGKIPQLNGLWQLSSFDISNNQIYGNLPQFPLKIKTISLSHNLLSGHITPVHKLRHLNTLDLSDNRFSGGINKGIFRLTELSHVNVSVNRFTVFEVVEFSDKKSQLHTLDVHANRLHGHLPVNLVTYPNLTEINLGHNLFSGEIPSEYWSRLRFSWRSLNLEYNNLEGSVPRELNRTSEGVQGNFGHNCLICPKGLQLCNGQRTASECHGGDLN